MTRRRVLVIEGQSSLPDQPPQELDLTGSVIDVGEDLHSHIIRPPRSYSDRKV